MRISPLLLLLPVTWALPTERYNALDRQSPRRGLNVDVEISADVQVCLADIDVEESCGCLVSRCVEEAKAPGASFLSIDVCVAASFCTPPRWFEEQAVCLDLDVSIFTSPCSEDTGLVAEIFADVDVITVDILGKAILDLLVSLNIVETLSVDVQVLLAKPIFSVCADIGVLSLVKVDVLAYLNSCGQSCNAQPDTRSIEDRGLLDIDVDINALVDVGISFGVATCIFDLDLPLPCAHVVDSCVPQALAPGASLLSISVCVAASLCVPPGTFQSRQACFGLSDSALIAVEPACTDVVTSLVGNVEVITSDLLGSIFVDVCNTLGLALDLSLDVQLNLITPIISVCAEIQVTVLTLAEVLVYLKSGGQSCYCQPSIGSSSSSSASSTSTSSLSSSVSSSSSSSASSSSSTSTSCSSSSTSSTSTGTSTSSTSSSTGTSTSGSSSSSQSVSVSSVTPGPSTTTTSSPSSSIVTTYSTTTCSSQGGSQPPATCSCPAVAPFCTQLIEACANVPNARNDPWSSRVCIAAATCAGPIPLLRYLECKNPSGQWSSQASLVVDVDIFISIAKTVGDTGDACSSLPICAQDYIDLIYSCLHDLGSQAIYPESTSILVTEYWTAIAQWTGFSTSLSIPFNNFRDWLLYYYPTPSLTV